MATVRWYDHRVFRFDEVISIDGDEEQEQRLKPKPKPSPRPRPTDLFKPYISVGYEVFSTVSARIVFHEFHLTPTAAIACQSFFGQEGEHYLHTHLTRLPFFTEERIQSMIPGIRRDAQRAFGINDDMMMVTNTNVESSNEEPPREVPFFLDFQLGVHIDVEALEETMSDDDDDDGMVPASEEAMLILLRKPNKAVEREQQCTICMEGFDDDDDDDDDDGGSDEEDVSACAMPCDHVFHRECIVQWLRTSHVCPLCRYAMPTVEVDDFKY